MNIETIGENINSTKLIAHERKIKIVEGDMTVPDIKPDILSLINVDNEVYITNKQIEDGKVNIEGVIEICAIYMSEDENSTLKSLNNSFTFYETFNIENVDSNSVVEVKTQKGAVECKVISGRKINIKSPITIDMKVLSKDEHTIAKDVVDDRNVEMQKEKLKLKNLYAHKEETVELRETVTLNEESMPIGEILKASIKIVNEDYKISYNKVLAKADATIKIIYIADNEKQSIEVFETSLPVMGFIDVDGINENMEVKLEYSVKSFYIKPIYQDFKSLSFSIESDIEIKTLVYKNEEVEVIADIYNPDMELKCEYREIETIQNLISEKQEVEIVQGLLIPDLDNIKILDINAKPNVSNKNVLDGKVALEGTMDFDILYYNENKKMLENKKMELPFQQVVKVANIQNGMDADVKIDINSIEYQRANTSEIQIKIITSICVNVEKEEKINGIVNIEQATDESPEMPSIVIYYVREGDSLWKIAKKFKTTVKELMEYNDLKDDVIYPNQQLIIPKRIKKTSVELL